MTLEQLRKSCRVAPIGFFYQCVITCYHHVIGLDACDKKILGDKLSISTHLMKEDYYDLFNVLTLKLSKEISKLLYMKE